MSFSLFEFVESQDNFNNMILPVIKENGIGIFNFLKAQKMEILIDVRGTSPRPWAAGQNEIEWRRAVANCVDQIIDIESTGIPDNLRVDITFCLKKSTINRTDLDNLAKPVLDTLFKANYVQVNKEGISGVLFEFDDSYIQELFLRKFLAVTPDDEGATIKISW
ncbi:hypothetical protein Pan110_45370 [Gimesia panareensis]|nr:hypothetical protein Pan110_45370 [Gimesia panareensis]